ncbi:MAG: lytic transglycosylase domain-containing protein [Sedimentitalea sp.]|uniref:lytic transglycosylase domain-containing protein n=1 Tax=Sedimentitalea sp. TaxID=2048915 RepID=UPI00326363E3
MFLSDRGVDQFRQSLAKLWIHRAASALSNFRTINSRLVGGAVLAGLLSIGPAFAQNDWGGIGDGWTSLNPKKIPEAARRTTAKASSEGQVLPVALTLSTKGNADNRALTRTVASRYAAHPDVSRAGIDPREFVIFFEEMILTESNYNDRALSSAGAIGLAQLMPGTAKLLGVDPHNRMDNLDGGARYLIAQINEFKTLSLAVAAYNAGPGAVRSHGGVPPYRETERHVAKVMSNYERRWRLISSKE